MIISLRIIVKIFVICAIFAVLTYFFVTREQLKDMMFTKNNVVSVKRQPGWKYILRWTSSETIPFVYMKEGQKGFIDRNCSHTNCFVTGDRYYLDDYTEFDVIAFAGPEVVRMWFVNLPTRRSPRQKYVFASMESSDNYPVCSNRFDGFFNWTWTFKLNSDATWGYIVVRDANNDVIGPKINMHWIKFEDMDPVTKELKEELKTKNKAAAWFVSNCNSRGGREKFVQQLQHKLKTYGLTIDVYGGCGPLTCPRGNDECQEMIRRDYYFYLSFENSFSEDYVTEKLLTSLKNTVVPIVYGSANYTRFMPDGIYLNARELGVDKLAAKMNELIKNPEQYAEYFRWKKYYSYHKPEESVDTNEYCRFCSMLFEKDLVNKTTVYQNFKQWWDPPGRC